MLLGAGHLLPVGGGGGGGGEEDGHFEKALDFHTDPHFNLTFWKGPPLNYLNAHCESDSPPPSPTPIALETT